MKKKAPDNRRKRKPVPYRYVKPESDSGAGMYRLLRDLVELYHEDIREAKIALAFHQGWEPDADGRVVLGKCQKVSDLHREVFELEGYDFVVILHQGFWQDPRVSDQQRRALLDHELCHAAVTVDDTGEPQLDECNRIVYRLRKHDLEEFSEIAQRYGCWKMDIEMFAAALARARTGSQRTEWVSYSRVRERLIAAGVTIPMDIIVGWTDAERHEADIWANVTIKLQRRGVGAGEAVRPAHVAAAAEPAVTPEPSLFVSELP